MKNEEKNYSKRMAALVMMIIYAAALSPMYVLAEERSTTETAIERFINTGISHTSERTPAENVAEDGKILVAEAPEKHAERTVKADHTNRVSESKETAEAAVQESKLLITKKEGGVIELGRVKIEIPPKSVKEDTEISITRLLKVNETGETLKNVTEENGGYRFLPKGTKFKKKVLISMPYSAELNLTEGELNELYTYFYDEEKAAWIKLERKEIDKENCLVKSYTTHFTDMINATLQVPETAGPVDFNINSIKSLEAARPDGHLLKFNPPKGTSSGDAAFSFTLDVPAGRKGMQPQVSVGYSSAGGSGIMGKGFDVNYGSTISIDTRKKLPDYDESDAYLKDGVKLKANGSTNKEYRLLRRSVREKIERHNAFSKDDWWEITDTHGTVYRYGYYKAYETTTNNAYAGKKDENGKDKIYTWYLSEVEDVDGNTILYEYEKDMGYVYPSRITYTGNVNDPAHKEGKYIVKFNYIKSTDEKHREDVRIDARSRFVTECRWLLGSIESGHVNRTTRKYSFEYNEGLAKEKYLTAFSVSNGTTEKDSSYTYRFEYNELEKTEDNNESVTYKIFDEPKQWLSSGAPVNAALDTAGMNKNNVSKSSSSSTGYNVNASFGVGVGREVFDARITGGGGGSSSSGTGYTNSILLDINGDGISDIVKQNGSSIDIYLCSYDRESKTFTYSGKASNQYIGTQINLEETESSSSTYNVYGGAGAAIIGAGYSYAHTDSSGSTQTKTGFSDVDGDGLIDIVTGSGTYLRNKSHGNTVAFEKKSISNYSSSHTKKLTDAEKKKYSELYIVQRPFKAWKVKNSGKIDVKQNITGNESLKGNIYIDGSKNPASTSQLKNLEVRDGQYIFFVPDLMSGKDDWNTEFNWNIQIDYNTVKPFLSSDNGIILALPGRAELTYPSEKNSRIKDNELLILSDLYEPREESSSGSGYTTYYAGLKKEYESIELTEIQKSTILSGRYFIPRRIENNKAAGNASFTGLLKKAAEEPKSDIYQDKRGAVKTVLESYVYDYVNDCFRYKGNRNTSAEKKILRDALNTVGYSYEKFLGDYRKDFAGITIGNSVSEKPVLYKAAAAREENKSQRKVNTRGRLSDKIIIIDDDILGEKTEEFNLNSKTVKCGNNFIYSGFEGDNEQPVIKIADKENKYIISYCFGNLTYAVPELSDEEFNKIYNAEYKNGSITEGIINELKTLEETPEGKDYKTINIDSAKQTVKEAFIPAIAQKLLSLNDVDAFISIVLTTKDDYYVLKNLSDDDKNKIRVYDEKLKFADFITTVFPYYYKSEADGSYWTLKSGLDADRISELSKTCKRNGYGLYQNFQKSIEYIKDGEYVVSDSRYNVLVLEGNTWENRPINFTEAKNNSSAQYSNMDLAVREDNAKIGSYTASYSDKNGETRSKTVVLALESEDTLYGGVNSWLYGIWQGNQNENAFSKEKLINRTVKTINEDDYKDYVEEEEAGKYETEVKDNGQNKLNGYDFSYYLPLDTSGYEAEGVWNSECGIEKESLTGNIDVKELQSVTDEKGCMKVVWTKVYSAPYIYKDKMVCNRLGGDTYYNIEGVSSGTSAATFCISKSRNENEEDSYGPQVSAAIINLSDTNSTGSGNSYQEQAFQDVTGDRIPDIIQTVSDVNNSSAVTVTVKKGVITDDKSLAFEDYDVNGVSGHISESNNTSSSSGAGVGLSMPALQAGYTAKGNPRTISMSMGTGGSTGSGHNEQTAGFIDLNGDGITDYIHGSEYKIGNGEKYEDKSYFGGRIALQESEYSVEGANYSLGLAGGATSKAVDEVLHNKLTEYFSKNNLDPKKVPECAQKLSCSVNVGGGVGNSTCTTSVNRMYLDVNADGLLDIIEMDSQTSGTAKVRFNTGSAFSNRAEQITLPAWDNSNKGNPLTSNVSTTVTVNGSLGVSVNISIPVWLVTINFTTSVGGGNNASSTANIADITMTDLDGDGKTDQVLQTADGSIWWKKNITGKAGLLKSVYLPQGGKYEIDYEGEYGTADNPGFKYVMSEVKVSDGTGEILPEIKIINDDGSEEKDTHEFVTKYIYEGAYYDREEKDSYGYKTVKTINPDNTYGVNIYSTTGTEYRYNLLGAVMSSEVYSSESKGYRGNDGCMSSNEVDYLDDEEWVLAADEKSEVYEKDGSSISNVTAYEYDDYGNVTYISQKTGDGSLPEVHAYIKYDAKTADKHIVSNPTSIKVFDHVSSSDGGNYLRYRSGTYDSSNGHLESITQYAQAEGKQSKALTTSFTYDETYGNIKTVKSPGGVMLEYGYDSSVNQFIESVSQVSKEGESYDSSVVYNYQTQTRTKETDCNGNSMEYEYDDWQRIVSIKSPKDENGIKAISYEYYCPDTKVKKTQDGLSEIEQHAFWSAVTKNKVNFDSDKVIETVVQTDGLGGVFRTAKTGVKFNTGTKENEKGWNVSGAAVKDVKGRTIKAGQNYFTESLDTASQDDIILKLKYATETEYDEKDRDTKIKMPFDLDNPEESERHAVTQKEYEIRNGRNIVRVTDAKGNITEQILDARGNITDVIKKGVHLKSNESTGEIMTGDFEELAHTSYEYDALGQMTSAFDIDRNETKVKYDLLGRKLEISTIDGGTYYNIYDDEGNLSYTTNSRLAAENKQITYVYDGFNRVKKIIYPGQNNETVYTYGSPGCTAANAKGRLLKLTDSSGTIEYEYGELGEVIREKRTLMQHLDINSPSMTAVMEYKSNYLGQMEEITYPDGETIVYDYDEAGQVCAVNGGHGTDYVQEIGYDEFGQRIYIRYGNGIETTYDYKKETRLLESIRTKDDYRKKLYQNIEYSFDKTGNVLGYTNNCMENGAGGNYITKQNYSYDNLYQLIGVRGETEFNKYNIAGAPTFKGRYSQSFNFDNLGNMTQKVSSEKISVGTKTGDSLNYSFDYEIAEGFVHRYSKIGTRYYKYDEVGNVICEQEGAFGEEEKDDYYRINEHDEDVYGVNDAWGYYTDGSREESRAKHEKYHREFTWDEKNQLIKSVDNTITVSFVYGEDGNRTNKYTSTSETLFFNTYWTYYNDGSTSFKGGAVSKHIFLGQTRLATAINDYNEAVRGAYGTEKDHIYYYHSDHLGSAQLITDSKGEEYQRIEYTPYGETWVDIKIQGNKELAPLSYRFSAKELDEETGFYYYGARYLDPKYSRWISCDPAMNTGEYFPAAPVDDEARKHNGNLPGMGGVYNSVNLNLYHYASNNPIKYTDPDGEFILLFGIALVVGLLMLPQRHKDGYLYFDNWQPQRLGGYYNFYETFTSNDIVCNIDSLRTDFTNSSGKKSSVWLWKGNYNMVFNGGWHIGAEVGAYGPHGGADDKMFESVSFSLFNKETGESVDREVAGKYWTNRFDKGKCNPSNLILTAKLTFKNEDDAKAYYEALCEGQKTDGPNTYFRSKEDNIVDFKATRDGKTVTVIFE